MAAATAAPVTAIRELAAPSFNTTNKGPDATVNKPVTPVSPSKIDFRNYTFPPLEPYESLSLAKYCGPTLESNWVIPGVLLAGAYPASNDDQETFQLLSSILKCGVKKFVCLQLEYVPHVTEAAWKSGAALRPYFEDVKRLVREKAKYPNLANDPIVVDEVNLKFEHCPIVDCGVTDDDVVLHLAEELVGDISRGEVIYLHCWGGHGRTGTVVSIMLHLMYGLNAKEAMRRCQAVHDLRKCILHVGSPQTEQQRDQVVRVLNLLAQQYDPKGPVKEKERKASHRNILSASMDVTASKHSAPSAAEPTSNAPPKKRSQLSRLSFNAFYDSLRGTHTQKNEKLERGSSSGQLPKFLSAGPPSSSEANTAKPPDNRKAAVGAVVVERMAPVNPSDNLPGQRETDDSQQSTSSALTARAPSEPASSATSLSPNQTHRHGGHLRNPSFTLPDSDGQSASDTVTPAIAAAAVAAAAAAGMTLNPAVAEAIAAVPMDVAVVEQQMPAIAVGDTPAPDIIVDESSLEGRMDVSEARTSSAEPAHGSIHEALMQARRAVSAADEQSSLDGESNVEGEAPRSLVPVPPKNLSGKHSQSAQFHKTRTDP